MKHFHHFYSLVLLAALFLISSCAGIPGPPDRDTSLVFAVQSDTSKIAQFAPVFIAENADRGHNRIGTAKASFDNAMEKVWVDPQMATYYAEERSFTTRNDTYINLIYRIHFSEVPFSLIPFYLGAGENVGLLVVATLNGKNQPMLFTIVHTCGCYLAFIPTAYLPREMYSPNWKEGRQLVYGENLPTFLQYQSDMRESLVIHLRSDTHRVKNVWMANADEISGYRRSIATMQPMATLESLLLPDGGVTSFYETSGSRFGYVKGSYKIWERLLISWWAFDWRVGEDKKLGEDIDDGIIFYTSLKPWARGESDLRDFAGFLKYWGWRL